MGFILLHILVNQTTNIKFTKYATITVGKTTINYHRSVYPSQKILPKVLATQNGIKLLPTTPLHSFFKIFNSLYSITFKTLKIGI